jgi:hypothetical protein
MPELILPCGQEEYVCTAISVQMYKRYTEIMEKNDGDSVQEAFEANTKILTNVFGVTSRKVEQADPEDVLSAAKEIHFVMQDVITMKFLDLNPDHPEKVEKEKSAFDEYDEENGYNEDSQDNNVWKICRDNVDRIVKICIRIMKNSYQQCMESDIISLLEHVEFEIRTIDDK